MYEYVSLSPLTGGTETVKELQEQGWVVVSEIATAKEVWVKLFFESKA